MYEIEKEVQPINDTIIKYEITEICETNLQQELKNETNINNGFSIDVGQDEFIRTKVAVVYLNIIQNSLKYICSTCKTCKLSCNDIIHHFEEFKNTCGNPLLNIKTEIDKDEELNTTKVCEIFMNYEQKLYFMCLYCYEHHTEMTSLSDHLLIHLKKNVLHVEKQEKPMEPTFTDALLAIKSKSQEVINNNDLISPAKFLSSDDISHKIKTKTKFYKCLNCKNIFRSQISLTLHYRRFHPKVLKINLEKERQINPFVEQFLKHLSHTEKIEFVQSDTTSAEDESSPIKLLNFCTKSLPNLLPQVFNNNNNDEIRNINNNEIPFLRNEKEIENGQNIAHNNSTELLKYKKCLPTIIKQNYKKKIDIVKLNIKPITIMNEQHNTIYTNPLSQVDSDIKNKIEILTNQKSIKTESKNIK